jgi:hypothetical protein
MYEHTPILDSFISSVKVLLEVIVEISEIPSQPFVPHLQYTALTPRHAALDRFDAQSFASYYTVLQYPLNMPIY